MLKDVKLVGRRSISSESTRQPPSMSSSSSSSITVDFLPSKPLRKMATMKLLSLTAIVCGIEFCGSAAFCFIPPMLLKAGIGEQNMSLVLGVGPLMGLFAVPIIGRSSDECRSRFGRRRPYIFVLSIILILSMVVLLSARYVGLHVVGGEFGWAFSIFLLVLGSIFLDFTCQVCLTPCEALLSDLSKDTDQHGRCFTVYSFMVSFGGSIGYLITALDWSGTYVGEYFGSQENCIFILLIVLFSLSAVLTFTSAKETPLSNSSKLEDIPVLPRSIDPGYVSDDVTSDDSYLECRKHPDKVELDCNGARRIPLTNFSFINFTSLKEYTSFKLYGLLPNVLKQLFDIPIVLRRLALANFCSWTSIMIFNLFYTDFVGQAIYRGDPSAPEGSDFRESYDLGVRMGSWGLLWHCILSAIYAAFVDRVVSVFNLQVAYLAGMASFTLSIFILMFSTNVWFTNLCATCTGFGYATLTTVPYLLLTSYQDSPEIYFCDTFNGFSVPNRGVGADLSTLDSAYFLSQVMLTTFMGYIVQHSGSVMAYMVCSFIMGVLSCISISRIIYQPQQMSTRTSKTLR